MAQTLAPPARSELRAGALTGPAVCGAAVALVVGALYWVGAGRPYGYDAAISVHRFIATGSLLDPFRRQLEYNNHVLFSFLDHVVYSVTGSADERVLRVLPIACVALAVGLLAAAVAKRLGWLAGVAAAAIVAANPILAANARDARGYGLLLLACVVSSLLLLRLRDAPSRGAGVGYVVVLAAGIATHLFGLAILPLHACAVGRRRATSSPWLSRWTAALVLGLLPYAGTASDTIHIRQFSVAGAAVAAATLILLASGRLRVPTRRVDRRAWAAAGVVAFAGAAVAILVGGSGFTVGSPIHTMTALLGGYRLVALALLLPTAAGLVLLFRDHEWTRYAATAAVAIVGLVWLVAPAYLTPRFFLWLLPAVAFAAAVAVARWRVLALVVLVAVAGAAYKTAHGFTTPEVANLQAARIARHVEAAGGTACAFSRSAWGIQVYDPAITVVEHSDSPARCDVLLLVAPWTDRIPARWAAALPYSQRLPAHIAGVVRSRVGAPGAAHEARSRRAASSTHRTS